ncbi:hypothetical protein [Thalassococcus sp. S3]|uniref:hypothetical protein n=1 Tax=Thalassococcus sp. S3 TaxID=2017482 RepID=UPI00102425D2|nr:hypothetical protein [Thalassococcus sp. S3]QBF32161.1 hypothetical protein CFI11_13160 [Thalassococcus sp. S3]
MSVITPEERRLIDDARAAGRTKHVPIGVSGPVAAASDKAAQARSRRAEAKRAQVQHIRDRRRFKDTPIPLGQACVVADADMNGTVFPSRIAQVKEGKAVLKDGSHNSKIGGDVLVGRLKGARIFTLTLEERATCPSSCAHWRTCYGNAMPHSTRWVHGPALEDRLRVEVAEACAKHALVLIRLHILGDFYSTGYVDLWRELLVAHPNLTVFGFTAWPENTEIGAAIVDARDRFPLRFMIRRSGRTGRWGSFTIDFPTEEKRLGDAIVCPEQREAISAPERKRHCGNCSICWASDAPIVFITH